jgi:hypothetical protein
MVVEFAAGSGCVERIGADIGGDAVLISQTEVQETI